MVNEPHLGHQQNVDRDHRRAEGQSQVAEYVERDLPLSLAGKGHVKAGRHAPGDVAAVGEEGSIVDGAGRARGHPAVANPLDLFPGGGGLRLVGKDVHHDVGRRAAGSFGKDIGHALEILVVDHLINPCRFPLPQFGQGNKLAGAAFHVDLRQVRRAGAAIDGKPQFDAQRVALGLAPHQAHRAAIQERSGACRQFVPW